LEVVLLNGSIVVTGPALFGTVFAIGVGLLALAWMQALAFDAYIAASRKAREIPTEDLITEEPPFRG
jgi:F0F1-type ATP synthase membrane subunit c/vacuolar-type H+-ATPase subunit K